jgi:hypothetical protein
MLTCDTSDWTCTAPGALLPGQPWMHLQAASGLRALLHGQACSSHQVVAACERCCAWCADPDPDLPPITPINIIGKYGYPVRNDNITNFGYVGKGNGSTSPETYYATRPGDPTSTDPIKPGESTVFKNEQTGLYCRLAPYGASGPSVTCPGQGMLCDQASPSTATVLTYTGTGVAYNGVSLSQEPGTGTLVLSSSASCQGPDTFTFPPSAWGPADWGWAWALAACTVTTCCRAGPWGHSANVAADAPTAHAGSISGSIAASTSCLQPQTRQSHVFQPHSHPGN